MILVVGGLGSGKEQFVIEQLGYSKSCLTNSLVQDKPVLMNLHELIKEHGSFDDTWLATLAAKEVVVCNEVGSGVVPLDPNERAWRDEVGRASSTLAQHATAVVRMVCGIPQVIKGTL